MYVRKAVCAILMRRALLLALFAAPGCGAVEDLVDAARGGSGLNLIGLDRRAASTVWEADPNHAFELAPRIDLSAQPVAVRGRIDGAQDVDVYDLGPVRMGDRVLVHMTTSGALDGAVALFDDGGASLLVNDHRNVYLGRSEPYIDIVIRRSSGSCWVSAAATPGYAALGDYALVASVEPGAAIPEPRPDVVLLDFHGGSGVRIGNRPAIDIPEFDASRIDERFAGPYTDVMIAEIVAAVRDDFTGFDVTVVSTSEGSTDDGLMSRIYFGTFDEALLGVAEGVDEYNGDTRQQAVVFTDTFSAFSRLKPSVSQMAQAIGNVASHEIGHLLGLIHTDDPLGLMDVTASLSELMRDQSFRKSVIHSAVFPIGSQDAVQYLLDSAGGDPFFVRLKEALADQEKVVPPVKGPRIPARDSLRLSTCGLH